MVCCARRFAEVAWRSYGKTDNWRNSPRFKLANATRTPDRALDVKRRLLLFASFLVDD